MILVLVNIELTIETITVLEKAISNHPEVEYLSTHIQVMLAP